MQRNLDPEVIGEIAELFKGFADPTRVKILTLLLDQEVCVTCLAEEIGISQSAVSHQLQILKQMRLIKYRREGRSMLYSLADDHVEIILKTGLEHVMELK